MRMRECVRMRFRMREHQIFFATRRDFTCDPPMREQIATIGRDIYDDACIIESERFDEILAWGEFAMQLENPVMIATKLQLTRTAKHALALHASDLGLLDRQVAGQRGAHRSERIVRVGFYVRRAAD